jgi:hypothetical protein
MQRYPFLKQIEESWCDTVSDYNGHKVLSERTLQASLWSHLQSKADQQYIFVEPRVKLPNTEQGKPRQIIPDLVICRSTFVIAVIELKFVPRGAPNFLTDINKLRRIYAERDSIQLHLPRFMGISTKEHTYKITDKTQFVLGCIGNKPPSGLASFKDGIEESGLKGRAAILLGETSAGTECKAMTERV